MPLKLFEHPLSPYVQKVKIALYEKGIPFDRVFIDPSVTGESQAFQEFVLASPRREVPALTDGATRVADSTVILEYLDDRYPSPVLLPESAEERARVRMLEEMMDTEYEAVNFGITEIKVFERAPDEQGNKLLIRAAAQLQRLWNRLEREFEGRRWMNGSDFGRGDLAVHPHVAFSQGLGFAVNDRHPRLMDWEKRVAGRNSVKRVVNESAEWLRSIRARQGDEPPDVVRQYRDHRLEWMLKSGGSDIVVEGLLRGTIRFAEEHE